MPRTSISAAFLALAAALAGCALQKSKPLPAAAVTPAAPRPPSPAQRAELDREFYKAVSAYMLGDYGHARERIDGILRVDPADKQALALKKRVLAAEKAGPSAP